jgi:hypothetical protein
MSDSRVNHMAASARPVGCGESTVRNAAFDLEQNGRRMMAYAKGANRRAYRPAHGLGYYVAK